MSSTKLLPLHVSFSPHHGDGGIAFAVNDLLHAQQREGVFSRWITADRFTSLFRDSNLFNSINCSYANVVHMHGLWRSHTRIAHLFSSIGLPVVISPHGMLDSWALAHSSWKKQVVWNLWESKSLQSAVCLHALCHQEAISIRKRIPDIPIAIIPNGVLIPKSFSPAPDLNQLPWSNDIPSDAKILLFLGRYHEKKGIESLMAAWRSVLPEAVLHNWYLVFVGFGDDNKFIDQLSAYPIANCRAYGPAFDRLKSDIFKSANAFILPSYSEGLPISALEAMAHGLPCLLSEACNLPQAYTHGAAIVANPSSPQLSRSLQQLFLLPEHKLHEMGSLGIQLVQNSFSWDKVAKQTLELYEWSLGSQCVNPEFLSNDNNHE